MAPLFKLITGSYVDLNDVLIIRLLDGNKMVIRLRTGQEISFPVADRAAFDAEVARINAARGIDSVAWEHAQLRELLKEAHECLRDYRGYIMGQTELSTSVDKLLFRIPNVLEATKPRK